MIFIDSDCIIDFLKGKKEAVNIVKKYSDNLVTTQINVFEIFFGILKQKEVSGKEWNFADGFFGSINIADFDSTCGKISARIFSDLSKKGSLIDQNGCFIGAIMLKHNCNKIITKNKNHFSRIKCIKVISY